MKNFNFNQWADAIIKVRDPENYTEAQKFNHLLDEAEEIKDQRIAKILFRLLTDKEDHGIKQGIVRILSGYPVYEYYKALIAELPEMLKRCVEKDWPQSALDYWGRDLINTDIPEIFRAYKDSTSDERDVFFKAIHDHDFFHKYMWPSLFLNHVKNKVR
jgi:hypothetical protein